MIFLAPFSVGRHGVSQAPHAILAARNGETYYHKEMVELPVHHYDAGVTANNLHTLLKGRTNYLVLGGDHSITMGVLRARAEEGPVHLVLYDAHSDDYDDDTVQSVHPLHSGNWVRLAWEEGLVSGVTWYNYRGMKFAKQFGNVKHNGAERVHVSVDIDVLAPAEYGCATPYPEVGGPTLERLLQDIGSLRFRDASVTADLVEYDPTRDAGFVGAYAASKLTTALLDLIHA